MKNKMIETSELFPQTDIWMDSFAVEDHEYALANKNAGITTSPTWVAHMLCDELESQQENIKKVCKDNPTCNEHEIIWKWTLEMGRQRSKIMLPEWEKGNPKKGRFAIQVSVYDFLNPDKILAMAEEVHRLGPNMQVKIPSTAAGISIMEEATYKGISVMATLCYTVDQAIAVAEAIERGLDRRIKEGKAINNMHPVCAVLLGMQEDWLSGYAQHEDIIVDPDALVWAGVAVCKKVYSIFKERGYRSRIITAYYRHHLHWSQLIGGDLIMTIPRKWQKRFVKCDIEIEDNMSKPIPDKILNELNRLEPFRQATTQGSLDLANIEKFGPVALTLRYFIESYEVAVRHVRDIMVPDPLK